MRFRVGALLAALALVGLAAPASALTLPVVGGPGLDQGELCPSSSSCPGNPAASLTVPAAATGSITFNSGPSTVDLTLTLSQNADFGGFAQILAGSTFTASGIPVITIPMGGGAFQIVQAGLATGLVSPLNLAMPGGASILASSPAVSGLSCTVGTGSDQCGASFGPGGLTFQSTLSGQNYDAFVTFNVNVPEPGTLATLTLGITGLAFASRRRHA